MSRSMSALAEPQGVIHVSAATFNWGLRGQVKNEKVREKIELNMDKLCQEMTSRVFKKPAV